MKGNKDNILSIEVIYYTPSKIIEKKSFSKDAKFQEITDYFYSNIQNSNKNLELKNNYYFKQNELNASTSLIDLLIDSSSNTDDKIYVYIELNNICDNPDSTPSLLKPKHNPFGIIIYSVNSNIYTLENLDAKIIKDNNLQQYNPLYSAYCNGCGTLFISGGSDRKKDGINELWIIKHIINEDKNLFEVKNIKMPSNKKQHSMIYNKNDNSIIFVGGNNTKCFIYDINKNIFVDLPETNASIIKPALIINNNILYVFDCFDKKKNFFEKLDLDKKEKFEQFCPEDYSLYNNKFFGVYSDDNQNKDEIIFVGGERTDKNTIIYDIKNNKLTKSNGKDLYTKLDDKSFYKIKSNYYANFPDSKEKSIILVNTIKKEAKKIIFNNQGKTTFNFEENIDNKEENAKCDITIEPDIIRNDTTNSKENQKEINENNSHLETPKIELTNMITPDNSTNNNIIENNNIDNNNKTNDNVINKKENNVDVNYENNIDINNDTNINKEEKNNEQKFLDKNMMENDEKKVEEDKKEKDSNQKPYVLNNNSSNNYKPGEPNNKNIKKISTTPEEEKNEELNGNQNLKCPINIQSNQSKMVIGNRMKIASSSIRTNNNTHNNKNKNNNTKSPLYLNYDDKLKSKNNNKDYNNYVFHTMRPDFKSKDQMKHKISKSEPKLKNSSIKSKIMTTKTINGANYCIICEKIIEEEHSDTKDSINMINMKDNLSLENDYGNHKLFISQYTDGKEYFPNLDILEEIERRIKNKKIFGSIINLYSKYNYKYNKDVIINTEINESEINKSPNEIIQERIISYSKEKIDPTTKIKTKEVQPRLYSTPGNNQNEIKTQNLVDTNNNIKNNYNNNKSQNSPDEQKIYDNKEIIEGIRYSTPRDDNQITEKGEQNQPNSNSLNKEIIENNNNEQLDNINNVHMNKEEEGDKNENIIRKKKTTLINSGIESEVVDEKEEKIMTKENGESPLIVIENDLNGKGQIPSYKKNTSNVQLLIPSDIVSEQIINREIIDNKDNNNSQKDDNTAGKQLKNIDNNVSVDHISNSNDFHENEENKIQNVGDVDNNNENIKNNQKRKENEIIDNKEQNIIEKDEDNIINEKVIIDENEKENNNIENNDIEINDNKEDNNANQNQKDNIDKGIDNTNTKNNKENENIIEVEENEIININTNQKKIENFMNNEENKNENEQKQEQEQEQEQEIKNSNNNDTNEKIQNKNDIIEENENKNNLNNNEIKEDEKNNEIKNESNDNNDDIDKKEKENIIKEEDKKDEKNKEINEGDNFNNNSNDKDNNNTDKERITDELKENEKINNLSNNFIKNNNLEIKKKINEDINENINTNKNNDYGKEGGIMTQNNNNNEMNTQNNNNNIDKNLSNQGENSANKIKVSNQAKKEDKSLMTLFDIMDKPMQSKFSIDFPEIPNILFKKDDFYGETDKNIKKSIKMSIPENVLGKERVSLKTKRIRVYSPQKIKLGKSCLTVGKRSYCNHKGTNINCDCNELFNDNNSTEKMNSKKKKFINYSQELNHNNNINNNFIKDSEINVGASSGDVMGCSQNQGQEDINDANQDKDKVQSLKELLDINGTQTNQKNESPLIKKRVIMKNRLMTNSVSNNNEKNNIDEDKKKEINEIN